MTMAYFAQPEQQQQLEWLDGGTLRILLDGKATGGQLTVGRFDVSEGEAPPFHIAAAYALAGEPGTHPAYSLYAHRGALNDILGGTNSYNPCSADYLCNAGPGYDGPTGLGTPNGTNAFLSAD